MKLCLNPNWDKSAGQVSRGRVVVSDYRDLNGLAFFERFMANAAMRRELEWLRRNNWDGRELVTRNGPTHSNSPFLFAGETVFHRRILS